MSAVRTNNGRDGAAGMDYSLWDLSFVTAVATLVGAVSGFFGVGGGFLLVPVLNIVLGVPIELAVGACACQILGLATTSLLARKIDISHARLPAILSGGLLCGVLLGAEGLQWAKSLGKVGIWGREVEFAAVTVLSVYYTLLSGLGAFSLWETGRAGERRLRTGWLTTVRIPPYAELPHTGVVSIVALTWLGLIVGAVSGFLGISGGLILLPVLTYLVGYRMQEAVIASLIIVWIASAQATAIHAWNGNVELTLVVALLLGGTAGARLGSEIGLRTHGRLLRRWFAVLLLGTAIMIAARLVWLLG